MLRCNYGKAKHSNGIISVDKFLPSITVLKDLYDPYLQCELLCEDANLCQMNSEIPPSLYSQKTSKLFTEVINLSVPTEKKICRMHPSFPASYPFGKGENKDF